MNDYKITPDTLALIPLSNTKTKIYEKQNIYIVNKNSKKLIEENCIYYGSSYDGRKKGTVDLIGITHKSPIVIEDSNEIIFFPTSSPRKKDCSWISLNNVDYSKQYDGETLIKFQTDLILKMPVSNKIINNQILRATRLESIHQRRKKEISEKIYENSKKSF